VALGAHGAGSVIRRRPVQCCRVLDRGGSRSPKAGDFLKPLMAASASIVLQDRFTSAEAG
jgi:hypothetical protein